MSEHLSGTCSQCGHEMPGGLATELWLRSPRGPLVRLEDGEASDVLKEHGLTRLRALREKRIFSRVRRVCRSCGALTLEERKPERLVAGVVGVLVALGTLVAARLLAKRSFGESGVVGLAAAFVAKALTERVMGWFRARSQGPAHSCPSCSAPDLVDISDAKRVRCPQCGEPAVRFG